MIDAEYKYDLLGASACTSWDFDSFRSRDFPFNRFRKKVYSFQLTMSNKFVLLSLLFFVQTWNYGFAALPDYIRPCKRDQDTINDCVKKSIEELRPRLAHGLPELNVPGMEPLTIPELIVDQGNVVRFKAVGRDVKVHGASNYKIKSLSVDLESLTIKARVYFPQLEFRGKYDLDARLLIVPIHGRGDIEANATRVSAEIFMQGALENKNGGEYLKFTTVATNINMHDYSIRLSNLFNGEEQFTEIANQILEQNRAEFLRASKPYIERTCNSLFKRISNRIAGSATFDEVLPV